MEGVEIKVSAEKGRGLYATRSFQIGDVIFQEKPLVSCQFSWNAAYGYLACEYCMRPLEAAEANVRRLSNDYSIHLPYPECCPNRELLAKQTSCQDCGAMFCSSECMMEANQVYHTTLCLKMMVNNPVHPINRLNDAWKRMHYPPETTTIMLVVKVLGMIKQCANKEEIMAKFNEFQNKAISEDQTIFHKLLGANFSEQIQELWQLLQQSYEISIDEFKNLLALIGTNGQGIGTSSFAEWVKSVGELKMTEKDREQIDSQIDDLYNKLDETAGQFLNNEGSALYLNQSKVNHSCIPNAEIRFPFSNFILSLTVIKNIEVGEEICISYLEECTLERSRHSRQKELKENYLFVCQCLKCEAQSEDHDVTSDDDDEDEDIEDEEMESD